MVRGFCFTVRVFLPTALIDIVSAIDENCKLEVTREKKAVCWHVARKFPLVSVEGWELAIVHKMIIDRLKGNSVTDGLFFPALDTAIKTLNR